MKKILLFVMLLSSFVYADVDLKDYISTSTTKTSSWTSPVTGEHYYYGGSYSFTFKNTSSYAPWFNVQAPGISIGCAGFSVKGGFISLLGLDEIKQQLTNAGSQLAWGIMIGLVYSMPGIGDVFMKIQKWARTIQKLLANMCNIGKALGGRASTALRNNIKTDGMVADAAKSIQNANKGITGFLDDTSDWVDNINDCLSSSGTFSASCKKKAQAHPAMEVLKISKVAGGSAIANYVASFVKTDNSPTDKIYIDSLSNVLTDKKIDSFTLSGDISKVKNNILFYRAFFGDTTISSNNIKSLLDDFGVTDISEGSYSVIALNKNKVAAKAEGMMKKLNASTTKINPFFPPENIAEALINGFSTKVGCLDDHTCDIPNNYILYADLTYKVKNGGDDSSDDARMLALLPQVDDDHPITMKWRGAIRESLYKIRYYVKSKSGYTPSFPYLDDTNATVEDTAAPLFVPGISKYIQIIANYEKKAKKETAFTASLKEMLAKYNAVLLAKGIIDTTAATLEKGSGDSSNINPENKENLEKIYKLRAEMNKNLSQILKENQNFNNIMSLFKNLEIEYRKEIGKNF